MISDKVKEILNEQINKEFYSSYLYLAMSAHLYHMGLYGIAKWFEIQAGEEIEHGMQLFDYVIKRKAKINLKQVETPIFEFSSLRDLFEQSYEHERKITNAFNEIANLTENECDRATRKFIDEYLEEQIEEENIFYMIIKKIKIFGESEASLYLIDKELGKRKSTQYRK